jgi:hypothetical protein
MCEYIESQVERIYIKLDYKLEFFAINLVLVAPSLILMIRSCRIMAAALVPALLHTGCYAPRECPYIPGFHGKMEFNSLNVDVYNGEIHFQGYVRCNSDTHAPFLSVDKVRQRIRNVGRFYMERVESDQCPDPESPIYESVLSYIIDSCVSSKRVRDQLSRSAYQDSSPARPIVIENDFQPSLHPTTLDIVVPHRTSRDIRKLRDVTSYYIRVLPSDPRLASVLPLFEDITKVVILRKVSIFINEAITAPTQLPDRLHVCRSKTFPGPIVSFAVQGGWIFLSTPENLSPDPPTTGDVECSVCLDGIAEGDELVRIRDCGHAFHECCISVWERQKTTCPNCRTISN